MGNVILRNTTRHKAWGILGFVTTVQLSEYGCMQLYMPGLHSVDLVCKEELNLMLKVLRLIVKVWWVELGGTDALSNEYLELTLTTQVLTLKESRSV